MRRLPIVLCLILLVAATSGQNKSKKSSKKATKDDGKIVGGVPAHINEFPYLVSLQTDRGHFCAGTIILPQWILTAAHCLRSIPVEKIKIRAGLTNLNQAPGTFQERKAVSYTKYQAYIPSLHRGDMGVIKLDRPLTNVAPVKLYRGRFLLPDDLKIAGWGLTSERGKLSNTLQKTTVPGISWQECQKLYGDYATVGSGMLCGGFPKGGKDACQGDSGGPAISVRTGTQVGIVSWGRGCARPGYPGVYTATSNFITWIENTTKEKLP